MSPESTARRRKPPEHAAESERRGPMFEVRHEELRAQPAPLQTLRDPFDSLPEGRPRTARPPAPLGRTAAAEPRQPMPIERMPAADTYAEPARRPIAKHAIDIQQADAIVGGFAAHVPAYQRARPHESPLDALRGRTWLLLAVAAVSLLTFWFASATPKTIISGFSGGFTGAGPIAASNAIANAFKSQNVPAGQHAVVGAPTITAQFIDGVLAHYGSPAQGTGAIWVEMGQRYGIDPAYALAFFIHESSAGTNPGWAGLKPGGSTTHNVGNIICAGYATCFGRFRDYDSWDAGIEDWYKLIANEYVNDRGAVTVEQIIPVYAPAFENDVNNYVQTVVDLADSWRQGVVR